MEYRRVSQQFDTACQCVSIPFKQLHACSVTQPRPPSPREDFCFSRGMGTATRRLPSYRNSLLEASWVFWSKMVEIAGTLPALAYSPATSLKVINMVKKSKIVLNIILY